ncbi:MAG: ornithine cyclodeaminase family protein [Gemmatimonadaceae bacterium]|nr:ornithine cyclodeaminase family protein [Gemmatimonadaceae bacterium]
MTDVRTLIVPHADVERLLPMSACIDVMAEALAATARGDALLPLRQVLRLHSGRDAFAVMPAILGNAIGAKVITVFPGNDATPYESHMGVILYFDDTHGRLLAIVDASSVTAIRTAAVSGLATRLLAVPQSSTLAILGAGVQAMTHLEAMLAVRPIREVRVWSRGEQRRDQLVAWGRTRFGIEVIACASAEQAVRDAHVICTVTASHHPVLQGRWVAPGAHINAVGASIASARELDTTAVVQARLFVDRRESAMHEAGDFLIPRAEEAIDNGHIVGELGDVVLGNVPGRSDDRERTLFKSLGLAVEDVASARFIYQQALATGTGTWLELGGLRPAT